MDNTYSKNQKVCGTCDFWMGQRTLDSTKAHVKIVSSTFGDCLEGGRKQTHKMNNAQCSKWQKWGPLK